MKEKESKKESKQVRLGSYPLKTYYLMCHTTYDKT